MPVRELDVREVAEALTAMCITANYDLPEDVYDALVKAREAEDLPADRVPICQDTGFAVIFAEVGQDVHLLSLIHI